VYRSTAGEGSTAASDGDLVDGWWRIKGGEQRRSGRGRKLTGF
ncbi:hypothetical protein A2U01_0110294, partial [Trifolium medium]|nr:hypothetical protein [Trifolium medium]